jgi:hypothetical protein
LFPELKAEGRIMSIGSTTPPSALISATAPARPRVKAVTWWAAFGALNLAALIYEWVSWLISGRAQQNTIGADQVPAAMKITMDVIQVGVAAAAILAGYWFVIRPWRRERRLTFDGMLYISSLLMCLASDPWGAILRPVYVYNSYLFNLGCPQCQNPLFVGSNMQTQYVEPLVAVVGFYGMMLFPGILITCWIMRKLRARFPGLSDGKLVLSMLPIAFLLDLVEVPWMLLGLWSYPVAFPSLTIFYGHYFQYPLHEGFFMAFVWVGFGSIRFFRNDKGQSLVERGMDELRVSIGLLTFIRQLAVFGAMMMVVIVFYYVPYQLIAMKGSDWPEDIVKRPYFTHGLCGPGTQVACGGNSYPIMLDKSATITPDGRLSTEKPLEDQTKLVPAG